MIPDPPKCYIELQRQFEWSFNPLRLYPHEFKEYGDYLQVKDTKTGEPSGDDLIYYKGIPVELRTSEKLNPPELGTYDFKGNGMVQLITRDRPLEQTGWDFGPEVNIPWFPVFTGQLKTVKWRRGENGSLIIELIPHDYD